LYYWDTYFTNKGLYIDGLSEYAYNNIENLKFCLRKFGCVPNMCRVNGADYASQPPLLYLMVKEYYDFCKDKEFLKDSYTALECEYEFWMTKRCCENGLNHYGTNKAYERLTKEQALIAIRGYAERVGSDFSDRSVEEIQDCLINRTAEGESGEDHTPRFGGEAFYTCALDLNCILYGFEKIMADFAQILGADKEIWQKRAKIRKERIDRFCLDENSGVYFDYNYKKGKRTGVFCAACYLPYVFGLTQNKEAIKEINAHLICSNGVTSCQEVKKEKDIFQWGYPNAWAPHQYYAYRANKTVGSDENAKEIACKWLDTVSKEFKESRKLFEKYDAVVGGKATVNEYGTPEMLGWTADIFKYFYQELNHEVSH
jgi:alpha,alpha-trehalase